MHNSCCLLRFLFSILQRWRHWKRETTSFLTVLIPWELRIKEIESHFGSGVASYFTFLRWLMWVNIMIAIPLVAFVIGPEVRSSQALKLFLYLHTFCNNSLSFWPFIPYLCL